MATSISINGVQATAAQLTSSEPQPETQAAVLPTQPSREMDAFQAQNAVAFGDPVHLEQSAAPSLPIQDYQTTRSSIQIDDSALIRGLQLKTNILHSWRGDLVITLISPSGRAIPVVNHEGGDADNVQATFDLSQVFRGQDAHGTWTLSVLDESGSDQGTLEGWGLVIDGMGLATGDEPK